MVATRARKRRAQLFESDDDDQQDDEVDSFEEAALALKEADAARAKKNKQRRIESFERNHPPFEMLPGLAIETILSFLDNSRDVYNISKCAKYIRECITPEIVVRSAVFGGGKTTKIVNSIIESIQDKSIHVPSTLRLLRLVNGTKCERGDQCFSYNLIQKTPETLGAKNTTRPFGLMICPTCAKCTSCPISNRRFHDAPTCRLLHFEGRISCLPFTETATGERAGPLVLALPVKQIEATYNTGNEEEKRLAFDRLYETIDQESPQDTTRAQAFVESYHDALSKYDSFVKFKHELAFKKVDDKHTERTTKRREKAMSVYEQVESLLDDYDHKELVLSCFWNDEGFCLFNYLPVDAILGALVRAPSKATKKNLATAVERVRLVVDKIHFFGLVSGTVGPCLDSFESREENYVKFVVHYVNQMSTYRQKSLLSLRHPGHIRPIPRIDDFVRHVENDEPFAALLQLLIHDAGHTRSLDASIFHRIVREQGPQRHKFTLLASKVWREHFPMYRPEECDTEEKFRAKFDLCFRSYRSLHLSIRTYVFDPSTIAFLEETGAPPHNPRQYFSRQNAVDKMYTNDNCIRFLRENNYASLLSLQRAYFQNPSYYGFY